MVLQVFRLLVSSGSSRINLYSEIREGGHRVDNFSKKVKALENKRGTEISKRHLRVLADPDDEAGTGECSEMLFQENPLNDPKIRKIVVFL
jgi:hypothetical protein